MFHEGLVYNKKLQTKVNDNRSILTIIGCFNKGKSHIANCLCGVSMDEGCEMHTLGPSLIYSREDNFGYVDTAGFEVPIFNDEKLEIKNENDFSKHYEQRREAVLKKLMTDEIQREFIISCSNVLVIVVGILSVTEQKMINLISKQYKDRKKYVIHNFYEISNLHSIKQKIRSDILYSFNTVPLRFPDTQPDMFPFYFLEPETKTYHLVIANSFIENPN